MACNIRLYCCDVRVACTIVRVPCLIARDANGYAFAYVFFEEPGRQIAAKLPTLAFASCGFHGSSRKPPDRRGIVRSCGGSSLRGTRTRVHFGVRELVDADFRNSRGCVSPSPARTTDTRVWQVMSYARHTENQFLIAPYLSLIVLISACSIFGAANGSSSTIPIPSAGQWVDFGRNEPTISSGAFTFPGQAELPATFTLGPRQR